ncbi:MAG: ABC transporter permease subunit [Opitutaceae bacterium]|nr:ABC transporter permease subunit [Opitutaceae bacterium]
MEASPSLDLSRWREAPQGVGYRRRVIALAGLRQLLRTRLFRVLLGFAWFGGVMIATGGFVFSQAVASGGWLESIATKLGPRAEAVVAAISGLVTLYPDICVRGVFTLLFWGHSFLGLWLSLVALTTLVPSLITRDRASHALVVYLSRPLTSADYLLGKLGTIVGVLLLVWTGPLLLGWVLSMLFATDRDFVVYSFGPLVRALTFNGIALVVLSAISLGVSALGRTPRLTMVVWICLWSVFGVMAAQPRAPEWILRLSYTQNLGQVRQEVFRLDDALTAAGTQLPVFDQQFKNNLATAGKRAESTDFAGALGALGVFFVGASFVFLRRLRPE